MTSCFIGQFSKQMSARAARGAPPVVPMKSIGGRRARFGYLCTQRLVNMVVSINGDIPIAGWFRTENRNLKWMITGGSPILGNLHMNPVVLQFTAMESLNLCIFPISCWKPNNIVIPVALETQGVTLMIFDVGPAFQLLIIGGCPIIKHLAISRKLSG
jgi:hypothetical protein